MVQIANRMCFSNLKFLAVSSQDSIVKRYKGLSCQFLMVFIENEIEVL